MAANNSIIHGHDKRGARSDTYSAWRSMMQRCFNPNNKQYFDYGGRGITVCEQWKSFANFLLDMGEVPKGLTLERGENGKGYFPGNCRWDSRVNQVRNRRNTKTLEFQGKVKPVAEWAEIMLIPYNTLRRRLVRGWDATKALTTKVMTKDEVCRLGALKRHECKDGYSKSFPFEKLPAPTPGASSPATATFNRAELERAMGELDRGVQSLVDQGSAAVIDLNTAKRWLSDLK